MRRYRRFWLLSCPILLGVLATPAAAQSPRSAAPKDDARSRGETLRASAAKRVEENAAAVTAALRELIASNPTPEGEELRDLVNPESSRWGIRFRDGGLLFSIPVRKNLSFREKDAGEREAEKLALVALTQRFSRLLDLKNPSQGLAPGAVDVIFIEPDAERLSVAGVGYPGSGGTGGYGGYGGTGWLGSAPWAAAAGCPCMPAPPPCGCE